MPLSLDKLILRMDYIRKIRQKLGSDRFIHPAARIIIENEQGQIAMIERTDNGRLGLPAGGLEENESIEACIRREVYEETGLTVDELVVIGISTDPARELVTYPNGDEVQYFTIEFYAKSWSGELKVNDTEEIKAVKFVDVSYAAQLPANERPTFESLAFYRAHGYPLLK